MPSLGLFEIIILLGTCGAFGLLVGGMLVVLVILIRRDKLKS